MIYNLITFKNAGTKEKSNKCKCLRTLNDNDAFFFFLIYCCCCCCYCYIYIIKIMFFVFLLKNIKYKKKVIYISHKAQEVYYSSSANCEVLK